MVPRHTTYDDLSLSLPLSPLSPPLLSIQASETLASTITDFAAALFPPQDPAELATLVTQLNAHAMAVCDACANVRGGPESGAGGEEKAAGGGAGEGMDGMASDAPESNSGTGAEAGAAEAGAAEAGAAEAGAVVAALVVPDDVLASISEARGQLLASLADVQAALPAVLVGEGEEEGEEKEGGGAAGGGLGAAAAAAAGANA